MYNWFKKYFIPHKANDHKPHALRHEAMMLFFMLVIIIELGFLAQVFLVFDKTKFLAAVLPGVLANLTNEERVDAGVPELAVNELLTHAAELKAQDMADKGYFAHTSPEGLTPWHWLDVVGYNFTAAGENLAVNFFESDDVDKAWMNSPSHRANIVKEGYKEIGIGVATGVYKGKNTVFVAQFFGTPPVVVPKAPNPTPAPSVVASAPTPKPAPAPVPKPTPTTTTTVVAATPKAATQVLGEEQTTKTVKTGNTQNKIRDFFEKALTSPLESANYAYMAMGLFAALALLLAVLVKSETHHPVIIMRGAAMVAVIIFLFYLNIKVVNVETEVPADSFEASVILH